MNRRDFIAFSGAAAAVAGPGVTAARALTTPGKRPIILACPYPEGPGGSYEAARLLAAGLGRTLGEPVTIVRAPAPGSSIAALSGGTAQFYFGGEYGNAAFSPALGFLAGLPGDLSCDAIGLQRLLTGPGERLWDRGLGAHNVKALLAGLEGPAPGLWSRQALSALSGCKVATSGGLQADVLRALGAVPVLLEAEAIAPALGNGTLDAAAMASLEDALALGLPRIAKICMEGALARHGGPLALAMPRTWWERLPSAQKAGLRDLAHASAHQPAAVEAQYQALRGAIADAFAVSFISPPASLRDAVRRVSEAVVADLAGGDPLCAMLNGATMAMTPGGQETHCRHAFSLNAV